MFDLQPNIRINEVHSKILESTKSNHQDYNWHICILIRELINPCEHIYEICPSLKHERNEYIGLQDMDKYIKFLKSAKF